MRIGYSENRVPRVDVLDAERIEMIRQAAFRVLEETGAKLMHKEARDMLAAVGARVKGEIVKLPRYIVQAALATCPKGFTIYNREGKPWMNMSPGWVYYGTSTASPNTLDAETDLIHPTTVRDIEMGAKVADALPNIDWVMPFGSVVDVPGLTPDIYEFDAVVRNTSKPVVCCGYSGRGTELVFEMAASIAGSLDDLVERPFVIMYPEPISPLVFSRMVADRILACATLRQPQIPCGSTGRGTTAPMTMAGMLALSIAESLFAITLAQVKAPGTPIFMAGNVGNANLATATTAIIPPERTLAYMGQAQVAASFGLPTWGLAGATESKTLDAQAGAEAAISLLGQTLGGSTIIHDVGYLDSGMICSADMLVLGDELIGVIRRIMRGIPVNEYELALEVINSVGPGGNFTRLKHTAENCRKDYWKPTGVFYREPYGNWEKEGSLDTKQRVRQKTLKILAEHKTPQLPDNKLAALDTLKVRAIKELAEMRQY
jgi:trimethylamine--corrinoid protein Co-methyltransferase